MNNLVTISCRIGTTDNYIPLGLEIWLDDQCVFDNPWIQEEIQWRYDLLDDDREHKLRWILKNKIQDHTTLDNSGNIMDDACVTITDVKFDDIELGHMFTELSEYHHDFNGDGPSTKETFYGTMGCNGTVSLMFTTPIYLWLLEHL